ncbi:hypothetical protein [Paenibacillus guangzhouensis]|uniref:hypothetical protein n=1 Tax=Paenibacillus guangzhouensis TaxID=1473112 RepID=UPI001267737C|nr:hypothetical protein [Paenibacillus guangzhouensis]
MKLLLDKQAYTDKPQEAGKISNRITSYEVDITLGELADEIVKGKTFVPATLKSIDGVKKRQKLYWDRQQIIALDIDEGLSLDQALSNPFIKENAAFIYTTFSHSPSKHKFRIVFALDKPVFHYEHFEQIWSYLFAQLPYADSACKDGVRLFYGGREVHTINMGNRVLVDSVLSKRGFESDKEYISNMSAQKPPSGKHSLSNVKAMHTKSLNSANNVQDILNRDYESLHNKLNPSSIQLSNMNEVHDYLKQQDLKAFLGIASNNFHDIFHDESKPSASIFTSKLGNGHQLYKCHSQNHPFCGTIFQVVERLLSCTNVDAEDFLIKVYRIELVETEIQKQMKRILDSNKRLLMSDELDELYPSFYKVINRFREDLYILFDLVKEYLPSGENPEIMFYHSIRKIGERLLLKHDSASRRLNFFVLLKLMKKLDEIEIPSELQESLLEWKQNSRYRYQNSVYSIPSYTYDLLSVIDSKCRIWLENGCTLKTISYEGIARNFGVEEANRVFPQDKDKVIPELNEIVARKLEESMLTQIHLNGFTTEKEVLESINLYFQGQKQFKQEQLKRCLGEIIESYCLVRVRLNKALREKLGYKGNGYPVVIMYERDFDTTTNNSLIVSA